MQDLAGDEGGTFEVHDRVDNIAHLAHPSHRMLFRRQFMHFWPMHRRLNRAGRYPAWSLRLAGCEELAVMTIEAVLSRPGLKVAPLARDTLQERAYRRICDLILDGEIAPGQVVTIQNLAETFGVSAMPVREALKRLTAAGALSLVAGRSIGVPRLTSIGWRICAAYVWRSKAWPPSGRPT
jgi:hypothetical protein